MAVETETAAADSSHQDLIARLVQAAERPAGAELPPRTAEAAWQLYELIIAGHSLADARARRDHAMQVVSWVESLGGATLQQHDLTLPPDDAMALAILPPVAFLTIDVCGGADDPLPWEWMLGPIAPLDFVRGLPSSAWLSHCVQLLKDPTTSPRDRVAASIIPTTTYSYFATSKEQHDQQGLPKRSQLATQLWVDSGLLRAFGITLLAALPKSSCTAAADHPWPHCCLLANNLHAWLSNAQTIASAEANPDWHAEFCSHCVDCGCGRALCQYIEAFERGDPADDASVLPWFSLMISDLLLMAVSGPAVVRRILAECCSSPKALHHALMACIQRGAACPAAFRMHTVPVRAGMCIALLFGREEDEAGANIVPPDVTAQIVRVMKEIVDGGSGASPIILGEALSCLSASDANTQAMVSPLDGGIGVLDVFTLIFQQDEQTPRANGGRMVSESFRYNIPKAREKCAEILLNLALSGKTAATVARHEQLLSAVAHTLADGKHLTVTAKRLLNDTIFQVKNVRGDLATPTKVGGGSCQETYLMMSYCWAQQAVILRLRAALGLRGYDVWIDVERLQGSTVDAMATAIDGATVVVYGCSEDYKNSQNCRLEAVRIDRQPTRISLPLSPETVTVSTVMGVLSLVC
eukprot:SAG31_NODE_6198_length_2127_cov_2.927022_1_plen_638_part_10